jgi:hypothetical protein
VGRRRGARRVSLSCSARNSCGAPPKIKTGRIFRRECNECVLVTLLTHSARRHHSRAGAQQQQGSETATPGGYARVGCNRIRRAALRRLAAAPRTPPWLKSEEPHNNNTPLWKCKWDNASRGGRSTVNLCFQARRYEGCGRRRRLLLRRGRRAIPRARGG